MTNDEIWLRFVQRVTNWMRVIGITSVAALVLGVIYLLR